MVDNDHARGCHCGDVACLIKGMPANERGRGKTIYRKTMAEAAASLREYLKGLDPENWWTAVELWLTEHEVELQ